MTSTAPTTPDREAEHAADHRRDQRLVADHLADLASRGADRAHHAQLVGALVDRQDQRVDDPEQRHDHRQRQQHVHEQQQLVDFVALLRACTPPRSASEPAGSWLRSSASMPLAHFGAVRAGSVGDEVHAVFALPERRARASEREIVRLESRPSTSSLTMPAPSACTSWPEARQHRQSLPHVQIVGARELLRDRRCPSGPSEASVAGEPCSHSVLYIFANDSGSIAVTVLFSSITGAPGLQRGRAPCPS